MSSSTALYIPASFAFLPASALPPVPVSVEEPLPVELPVEPPLCDPVRSRSLALPVEDPVPVVVELPVPDD